LVVTIVCLLVFGGGTFAIWKSGAADQIMAKFRGGGPPPKRNATPEEMRRELAAKTMPAPASAPATPAGWNAAGPPPTNMPSSPSAATQANAGTAAKPATPAAPPVPSGKDVYSGKILSAYDDKQGKGIRYLEIEVDKNTRYVGYRVAGGQPGLELSDLSALKGKNAKVTGELLQDSFRGKVLFILSRGDITVQP
jgi:hypothetical protein